MNILDKPLYIRGKRINSRCFLAPINTGYSRNGNPDRRLIQFHQLLSSNHIGISLTGTTAISRETKINESSLILDRQSDFRAFKDLSDCIKSKGSLPGIQLGFRIATKAAEKSWKCLNKREFIENTINEFSSYSEEFFDELAEKIFESVCFAVETGFEVIQLHAAHGYFLSLLLSEVFNPRKDKFRYYDCDMLFNVVRKIRRTFPEKIISVRLNCIYDLKEREEEIKRAIFLAQALFENGVDHIDFSAGIYDLNKNLVYPSTSDGHACYADYAFQIRKKIIQLNNLISFAGNIWDLESIDKVLPENMAISIGRSLLADPEFITKYFENRSNEIVKCLREQNCPCHFYSNSASHIGCAVNKLI